MEMVLGFIKSVMLIFIPFTWILGIWLKRALTYEGNSKVVRFIGKHVVKTTSRIKVLLYVIVVIISICIGFAFTDKTGSAGIVDAVLIYGVHGAVCVWLSELLYDKVREKK